MAETSLSEEIKENQSIKSLKKQISDLEKEILFSVPYDNWSAGYGGKSQYPTISVYYKNMKEVN
jgi:hypothetical protein